VTEVTVVIPTRNRWELLSTHALPSALSQEEVELEVVIVDDGSTDDSRNILGRYGNRVTTITQENSGQGAAYNAGFAASCGEFVCFLDADDALHPNAITTAIAAFDDIRIAKVEWQLEVIDASGRKMGSIVPEKPLPPVDLREETIANGPFYDWWITSPGSGTCYRRSMLDSVLPMPAPENRHGADVYLTVLAPIFGEVRRMDGALGCYRQHEKNNYFGRELSNERLGDYVRRFEVYSAALQIHLFAQGVNVDTRAWKQRNFNYLWPSRALKAKDEIERVIPTGADYLLIDDNELAAEMLASGRRAFRVVERDGVYWGPPSDAEAALAELEQVTAKRVDYIVIWWTAFWWLTEYFALDQYLNEHSTPLIESDALKIFKLCRPAVESRCASLS